MRIIACLILLAAGGAFASDQTGIYARVDRVVEEPNRIQVFGTFLLADLETREYRAPQKGYLYFSLPPGEEAKARVEWADLARTAGSKDCVAFARRRDDRGEAAPLGRVRPVSEKPDKPDTYPLGHGMYRLPAGDRRCQAIGNC